MNEISIIILGIVLFVFGFGIKPHIVKKYHKSRHQVEIMFMAVSITVILVPIIYLIAEGLIPFGSYFIALPIFVGFLVDYGIKHRKEMKEKTRQVFISLLAMYTYIFLASGILMFWAAPFMPNIVL